MTAINEQGQVYFTFEELDLEGTYNELEEHYWALDTQMNVLRDLIDKAENIHGWSSPITQFIRKEWDELHLEKRKTWSVQKSLKKVIQYV